MTNNTYRQIKRIIKSRINLNNGYTSDDLIQEVSIKLIQSNYKESEYCRVCYKIARNIIIDHHRKCQRFKYLYDIDITNLTFENEYELKLDKNIVIPDKYKELYILRNRLGLKYIEISEILNKPLGTVQNNLFNMKKELIKQNETYINELKINS